MKRAIQILATVAFLLFVGSQPLGAKTSPAASPTITRVRHAGTNVIVTAVVPAGWKSVTLESRGTNGVGAWKPRAIRYLHGKKTHLVFRVAQTDEPQVFRLTGSTRDNLPRKFLRGKKSFPGVPSSAAHVTGVFPSETARAGVANFTLAATDTQPPTRNVVESDIWKISGDRLYYFNQYRGLQILDISNPDSAALIGTVDFPAAGEQMYLFGNHVVLLARDDSANYGDSQIVVIDVSSAPPQITTKVPVSGSIRESRIVGHALYLATQSYFAATNNGPAGWGTAVSSFDLANPAAPVARGSLWFAGYGHVVAATDRILAVVTQEVGTWQRSRVNLIDITSPNGTMQAGGAVQAAGYVGDKFKINSSTEVLTVISEVNRFTPGELHTVLETFSLANISSLAKLGELEFATGDRLFATRFDSNRVYVVTFRQVDPLWIVDISDPANPQIQGSVEVPGYSTFIQPLGDRLVTVGLEVSNGWRVAVSLFDVSDVANPALLSRVTLGEYYSWSEANWDEKAFNVLPEDGLILVPFQGHTTNGYASRVQLIDWRNDSLTLRGAIDHTLQPRRATVSHNRILSISGWEFLAVDATDRDHPVVTRELTLAWPVDRVIVRGDYLLEFGTRGYRFDQAGAVIRVALADSPDQLVGQWSLGDLPIVGATVRGDLLYLLQSQSTWAWFGYWGGNYSVSNSVSLTVIDLAQLPNLQIIGQTQMTISNSLNGWDVKPLWVRPDLLVWESMNSFWYFPVLYAAQPLAIVPFADSPAGVRAASTSIVATRFMPPWFYGGGSGTELVAFDVSDSANPQLASELNVRVNGWSTHNAAFATNGLVYLSHTRFDSVSPQSDEGWVESFYLDVIDYSDAANPTVRDPVPISGSLAGISHEGQVLYTISPHDGRREREWLDALAYDGVQASLIDSLALSPDWPRPALVADANIFLGLTPSGANAAGSIEVWNLGDSGEFVRASSLSVDRPADTFALFGKLLAAQSGNHVQLIDASDSSSLKPLGSSAPQNLLWFNLDRADGSLARGLWVPLGDYGVWKVLP